MAQIVALEGGEKSIQQMWQEMGAALGIAGDDMPVFLGGGASRVKDIVAVIRHGLIGGGEGHVDSQTIKVGPLDATRIIENYVHGRPIAETLPVAWAILQAAIFGVRLKKKAPPVQKPRSRSVKGRSSQTAATSA